MSAYLSPTESCSRRRASAHSRSKILYSKMLSQHAAGRWWDKAGPPRNGEPIGIRPCLYACQEERENGNHADLQTFSQPMIVTREREKERDRERELPYGTCGLQVRHSGFRSKLLSMSMGPCRFDTGCWRPLFPYRYSWRRAARWIAVWRRGARWIAVWRLLAEQEEEYSPERIGEQTVDVSASRRILRTSMCQCRRSPCPFPFRSKLLR